LLQDVAVFTLKAWEFATRNILVGAANVHVAHSEVKEGIVDVLVCREVT
jgi:hypothetical protein